MDEMMMTDLADEAPARSVKTISRKDIETALVLWLREGHERAVALSLPEKQQWARYRRMEEGTFREDDPKDPWVKRGVWMRPIAKAKRLLIANVMNELMPDPQEMDWAQAVPEMAGLDEYAERVEALVRKKLRQARPFAAKNVYDLTARGLSDLYTCGNKVRIVTHEAELDADHDEILDGPTPQYIDPRNLWPWRRRVNELRQTACTIWDPITHAELMSGRYYNREEVVAKYRTGEAVEEIDPDGIGIRNEAGVTAEEMAEEDAPTVEGAYRRLIYFGPFPCVAIREHCQLEDAVSDEEILAVVAQAFELGPEATVKRWWHMHRIEETLILCEPYPLPTAHNDFPVRLIQRRAINGDIWGRGLYWECETDERLANFFKRASMSLSAIVAKPPFWYLESLFKKSWLQKQGGVPRLAPGTGMPLVQAPQTGKPVEHFAVMPDGIPLLEQEANGHLGAIREDTGAVSAIEGNDQSRTATQGSNNLSQALALIKFQLRELESYDLLDLVENMYVVQSHVMREFGNVEMVAVGYNEARLKTLDVRPEHMVSMSLVSFRVAGSTNPGNKERMLQEFKQFYTAAASTGLCSVQELLKQWAQMIGIRGLSRLWMAPDMADVQEWLANLMAGTGYAGMEALPPGMQQALIGTPLMPGMPFGGGGQRMLPGPGQQGDGGGVAPRGPAGLPMMAGSAGSAGPGFMPAWGM
jgi:hypothetical protein